MRRPRSTRATRSAPLRFACPYCRRHNFKSIKGLNTHIGMVHEGSPKVRPRRWVPIF